MKRLFLILLLTFFTAACSDADNSKGGNGGVDINGDAVCGNGVLDTGEACDGASLNGETCEGLGLGAGELACRSNCGDFDRSACGAPESCGDGSIQAPEACDGTDLAGTTCESLGFGPGTLGCSANCAEFDTSMCGAVATCGNGQLDENELCDGSALGGASCGSLGRGTGTLGCSDNCQQFDTTGCSSGCTPECGGRECGPDPACGSSCGTCGADELCSSDGMCVCQPTTCAEAGAQCGSIDDGCGGTLDCGGCDGATECGAGGTPNVCACPNVPPGGTVSVDVPTVEVTFALTVGGQPLNSGNTTYNSQGALELVDTATGDRIGLGLAYSSRGTASFAYPSTRRITPGTYDIVYDSFSENNGVFWPLNNESIILEDVDLTSSKTVNVDIPVVDISFGVTVGGQGLTAGNTTYNSQGSLEVADVATGDRIGLGLAYSSRGTAAFAYPNTKRLVPGSYDIFYDSFSENNGTFWPLNNEAKLRSAVALTSTQSISVDVPVVDVTFDVTVGGQGLTSGNTTYNSQASLEVEDTATGDRIGLGLAYSSRGTAAFAYPATKRLVPGSYDVIYDSFSENNGTFWPLNNEAKLRSGVMLNSTQSVTLDVPVVDVTFAVTVGGQGLNVGNTTYNSQGSLEVEDVATGDRIGLGLAYSSRGTAAFAYPATKRLVPGNYNVFYDSFSENNGTFWPLNNEAELRSNLALNSTQSVTVDIPVVDVTFDVTVGGQGLNVGNTTYNSQGSLEVEDVATGDRIGLGLAYSSRGTAAFAYPATKRLVPGNYDVFYDSFSENNGTFWPLNNEAKLRSGLALNSTQTVALDVPAVDITFGVTVGGQGLTSGNTTYNSQGALELEDTATGDRIGLGLAYSSRGTAAFAYPATKRIVPGTYNVFYDSFSENNGTFWPLNNEALLSCFTVQ